MLNAPLDDLLLRRLVEVDAARTEEGAARSSFVRGQPHGFSRRGFGSAIALRDGAHAKDGFLNRVVGFTPADTGELDAIIAHYDEIRAPCQIDLTPDAAAADVLRELDQRGFRLAGGLCVFRAVPQRTSRVHGVHVQRVDDERSTHHALDVLEAGDPDTWREGDRRARWGDYVASHHDFAVFVATIDSRPVAISTLLFTGTAAHLSNSYTIPDARGRGCQVALLERCVDEAAHKGCDLAVVDTWFGTPSHRNVERVGFHMAYVTTWMTRPPTAHPNPVLET